MSALPLERLFESPALAGPVPGMARYAPDGRRVAFLRPADDDHERLDLWLHDVDSGAARRLVDARTLGDERALSDAEKARRERLRVFSAGIVEFLWTPDGRAVLFPLAGRLYRVAVDETGDGRPEALTSPERFVTDVRAAADGTLGFVDAQNLHVRLPDGEIRALTTEGGGTVSFGLPDFIAAEEMHRHDGYWFSPDGTRIAVLRVDEAPIPVSHRYEIDGDGFSVHAQHYPYTGGPNAEVRLVVVDVATGAAETLEWRGADSEYLARVDWRGDGTGLWIQRQPRDQRTLELVELSLDGAVRVLCTERSDSWVNLTDDLREIESGAALLWSSEAEGPRRLYRLDAATGERTALGPPEGQLVRVLSVDERSGEAWIEARIDDATRNQVYRLPLAGGAPRRVTDGSGCHTAQVAPDHGGFLDRHESLAAPPALALRDADGALRAELQRNDPHDADHPYHPFLAAHRTPELGTLRAEDGQTLYWRLTRPAGDGPHPVVVAVYGGPGVARVHDAWTPLVHQVFAAAGWAVFELDNRGSAGRGRDFEAPIFRRMGRVEIADQMRGVEYLKSLDWVDGERLAIFGHSYGGYMALMGLAQHPEVFRAAVSVAPVTDWMLYDTHYTERYLAHPDDNPEGYRDSAVFAHLDGLVSADPGSLLLMHGMADDNVLFTHTTRLMKALQDRGVPFELMTYPAAKHGLAGRAVGLHRFRLIRAFLARRFGEPVPGDTP